jgi:all-trans-retinol dehydrogenase (NAD+)
LRRFCEFQAFGDRFSSSDNIGTMIFETLLMIIDVIVLHLKFWFATIEGIIKLFTAAERDVSGDIVLITGAGHGMGKQLALQYSELGATIVCWDINEKLNLETVKLIKSKGKKAFGFT